MRMINHELLSQFASRGLTINQRRHSRRCPLG
jgi:hypothetical protein